MRSRLYLVALAAALLAGCAPGPTDPPTVIETGPGRAPSLTDPQMVIESQPGREFQVVIESNPTTGYHWEIVGELDAGVVELAGRTYQSTSQPGLVGGGGIDIWTFKAMGPGETKITLGSFAPSSDSGTPSQTEIFTVRVQ